MIRYRIDNKDIYGVKNLQLFFEGWIESEAKCIIVELDNNVVLDYPLPKTKSKIKRFSLKEAIPDGEEYKIYALVNDKKQLLSILKTNTFKRSINRITPTLKKRIPKKYSINTRGTFNIKDNKKYNQWLKTNESFSPVIDYGYQPKISIVMPVYNVSREYLSKCLDSILNQTYQNFEICIADDCSSNEETKQTLLEYMNKDTRIKVVFREKNGHISLATNSALELASGEFVGLMDNDDELMPQALNEVVKVLNDKPNLDFIYSDEDKIDLEGNRSDPSFKPDLCIDSFYGGNYICHFSVIRKRIIEKIGGFKPGVEGAQDFDLFLRIIEETDKFFHIPKILYHWRMIPGSTALESSSKNYAGMAGKKALEDLFDKKGIDVSVDIMVNTHYLIEYLIKDEKRVNVLMNVTNPQKDFYRNLKRTVLNTLYKDYKYYFYSNKELDVKKLSKILGNNYEIVNQGDNFCKHANDFAKKHKNELICLMNEHIKMDSFNWMNYLAGYALQECHGVVAGKTVNEKGIVKESGYILNKNGTFLRMMPRYRFEYGEYGRLLVPFNYQVVNNKCVMIRSDLFNELNGLNENEDYMDAVYELCLKANKKYRNVFIPCVVAIDYSKTDKNINDNDLIKKYPNNFKYDKNYNENLSNTIAFRLKERV